VHAAQPPTPSQPAGAPPAAGPLFAPAQAGKPKKRRGLWWRLAKWGGLAAALLFILFLLCTRGFIARKMVERTLASTLGAEVQVERVVVSLSGSVLTEGLSVRVPAMAGEAGQVLRAARIDARGPLLPLLRGQPRFSSVTVDGLTARISQHVRTGRVNLAGLAASTGQQGGTTKLTKNLAQQLPSIALRGGIIELGEHDESEGFSLLKSLGVSGTIDRMEESGASVISFRQTASPSDPAQPVQGGSDAFIARGRIEPTGVTLTISGIDFSSLTPTQAPAIARELFAQSMLEGAIPQADLVYNFDGTWRSKIALAGVSMNLPVESRADAASATPGSRRMRLLNTSGEIELSPTGVLAKLAGYVEELPYAVTLEADGPGVANAWKLTMKSESFQLERRPEILRFVPPVAQQRLADFGDPTGIVDATVVVSRAALMPGQPEPAVQVQGTLHLRDVKARFHKFPYPWERLHGEIVFDEKSVLFRDIRGSAGNGATIEATVRIEPPTEIAGVEVQVRVRGMPIDEKLRSAMEARGQGRVLDELLDEAGYAALAPALIASGITPPPALGGKVDVDVFVRREVGVPSVWSDRVDIAMHDVVLMPRQLGYPLRTQRVTIVQQDNIAHAKGDLVGLTGAGLTLDTTLDLRELMKPDATFAPPLRASLRSVPIDTLLIAALEERGKQPKNQGAAQAAAALRELGVRGTLSGDVQLDPQGDIVKLEARGEASPPAASDQPQARLRDLRATITVEGGKSSLQAWAKLPDATGFGAGPSASPASGLPVDDVSLVLTQAGRGEPTELAISGRALDLSFPLAPFIQPFAPKAADRTREVFALLSPQGRVEASFRATLQEGGGVVAEVLVTPASPLRLRAGGESFELLPKRGSFSIDISTGTDRGTAALSFRDLAATINQATPASPESATPAELQATGTLLLDASAAQLPVPVLAAGKQPEAQLLEQPQHAVVQATDVAIAGTFARSVLGALGQQDLIDTIEGTQADGLVDVRVVLSEGALLQRAQQAAQSVAQAGNAPALALPPFVATLEPSSLSLGLDGVRHVFDEVSGALVLEGSASGRVQRLRLVAPGVVQASVDGAWGAALARSRASASVPALQGPLDALDLRVAIEASSLSDHVRAMLPREVLAALTDLDVRSQAPISLPDLALQGTLALQAGASEPAGTLRTFAASGTVRVERASAKVGVQVDDARGELAFRYTRATPRGRGEFFVDCALDGLRVLGVGLTDGRGQLRSTPRGGLLAEQFSAQVHGGRVTGALSLAPPVVTVLMPGQAAPGRWYDLSLEASNVRFAPLLEEGRTARGAASSPVEEDLAPDGSRGVLSGSLTLAGSSDDTTSRRGRGTLTVRGGKVVSLPVVVPLLRVSNLQLPSGDSLDYALADFFMQGEVLTVEQLSLSSRAVGLYGFGTMRWPGMDLDLRFRAANRSRIPILTAIIESVREELVTTTVRGTLDAPDVQLRPLDGTRSMLRDLAGGQATDQERRLLQIEKQVTPEQRRARPGEDEVIEPRDE
jgi:hypothetical protein